MPPCAATARLGRQLALAALCWTALLGGGIIHSATPLTVAVVPPVFNKGAPASIDEFRVMERHVEVLVQRVSPAVVSVLVNNSGGSGVVISADGLVLTAAHVCGAPNRTVHFTFPDGRKAEGKTLGTNHEMDSGLMQITDGGPWPYVEMGKTADPAVGDWVLALGHPGGFNPERSVVARLGRIIRTAGLLQSDCTLMSGDSGGPLFNMRGEVIAIHSRISDSTADNYHVPLQTYVETWDRLAKGEDWGGERRGPPSTIGVKGVDDPEGCRLERINEDGPGFRAGLKPGDIVLRISGERIPDAQSFGYWVRKAKPGDDIWLLVKRDDEEITVKVRTELWHGGGRRRSEPPTP